MSKRDNMSFTERAIRDIQHKEWLAEKREASKKVLDSYPELSKLTIKQLKEICKTENILPYGDKCNLVLLIVNKRKKI